ncbi:Alpha/beta hydrolase family-domain-containing protein [Chiua virens]|nr:Alpha/beta hydrolase family-domain-containing protein [Chiua virens]
MTQPESAVGSGSSLKMFSKSYVFDPRPCLPFRISAKRYWMGSDAEQDATTNRGDQLTLVFAHAVGYHKEHWEPVIHRLFEQQWLPASGQRSFRVQDMWALDAPNHGDSAVLNEDVIAERYNGRMFSCEAYARCVHAFLAGLGTGVDVDFSKRTLVAVGHSLGAAALLLSIQYASRITFASIHLVEPIVLGSYAGDFGSHLADGALKRRDTWDSTDEAHLTMKSRPTWRSWDDRVLRLYVEHGLRPLPTCAYPDRTRGVTLKCTTAQEAACFRDNRSFTVAYDHLPRIMKKIPTHITYGEMADFLPAAWKQDVLYNVSGSIANFASATVVPGAGHLMVQTHPEIIADVIGKSLLQTHARSLAGRIHDAAVTAKL